MSNYNNKYICPKCGGYNDIVITDIIHHEICEAETACKTCEHKDFWAYGYFASLEGAV